jgi:hypothetical protein
MIRSASQRYFCTLSAMVLRRTGVAAARPRFASEVDALARVCRLSSKLIRAMTW